MPIGVRVRIGGEGSARFGGALLVASGAGVDVDAGGAALADASSRRGGEGCVEPRFSIGGAERTGTVLGFASPGDGRPEPAGGFAD